MRVWTLLWSPSIARCCYMARPAQVHAPSFLPLHYMLFVAQKSTLKLAVLYGKDVLFCRQNDAVQGARTEALHSARPQVPVCKQPLFSAACCRCLLSVSFQETHKPFRLLQPTVCS